MLRCSCLVWGASLLWSIFSFYLILRVRTGNPTTPSTGTSGIIASVPVFLVIPIPQTLRQAFESDTTMRVSHSSCLVWGLAERSIFPVTLYASILCIPVSIVLNVVIICTDSGFECRGAWSCRCIGIATDVCLCSNGTVELTASTRSASPTVERRLRHKSPTRYASTQAIESFDCIGCN